MQDSSISFSSHLNKSRFSKITTLENTLAQLEVQQQATYYETKQVKIDELSWILVEQNSLCTEPEEHINSTVPDQVSF